MDTTHILLVEDDEAIALSLGEGLKRESYDVHWCNTGIAYAQQHHVHLIILDVRLPDGSGFDFCRKIRQSGLHQPVIMLTVQRDEVDKVLGLEMGADDYVTKPFSLRVLLSRVKAQLRRAYGEFSSAESNLLYIADMVIDRNREQIMRGNHPLNLTPTEFRLLVYLAQHPHQVLTRNQIMDAGLGLRVDPGKRTCHQ